MDECRYCGDAYIRKTNDLSLAIYPAMKEIVATIPVATLTGEIKYAELTLPCRYCPACGRKLGEERRTAP